MSELKPRKLPPVPTEDEVLRRKLAMPPDPHVQKAKPKKGKKRRKEQTAR